MKLIYVLDGKREERDVTFRVLTRALLDQVRPLFEKLDNVPANAEAFNEEFLRLLKDHPDVADAVKALEKSPDISKIPAEQRSIVAEVAMLRNRALAEARKRIGGDNDSIDIAMQIFKIVVDTSTFSAELSKEWKGALTTEFWMGVDTRAVREAVGQFRVDAAL